MLEVNQRRTRRDSKNRTSVVDCSRGIPPPCVTLRKETLKQGAMRKLKNYQKEGKRVIEKCGGKAGLFMAPGTGKTLTTIRYFQKFDLILIVCRRDDFMTWVDELEAEGWNTDEILCINKSTINWGDLRWDMAENKYRVVMVTYDLCKNSKVKDFIRSYPWEVCVADECHYLKRWKTARTKSVIRLTRAIPRRIGLTGTPITNEPLDVFSICLFIDNGITFGDNEWRFKKKYYLQAGYGWHKRRGSKDLIAKKLKRMSFHVHEDDVLKLPPKREIVEYCPMSGMQRKHYERILNDWEYQISNGETQEIDHVLARMEKLKQVASGFIIMPPDEGGVKKTVWLKSGKLKKLEKMLYDPDVLGAHKKIVVWCSRTAEIMAITKMARSRGDKVVKFHGSNRKLKESARRQFRDSPKVRLFVGQVDSGVGMNELVVASDSVYFSNSFKVVSRQQSMRRTRRIGSEHHKAITYWDLVSENTVDKPILKSVKQSMNIAQTILDQIKRGAPVRTILNSGFKLSD